MKSTKKSKWAVYLVISLLVIMVVFTFARVSAYEKSLSQPGAVTLMTDVFSDNNEAAALFEKLCLEETGIELKIIDYPKTNWELFLFSSFSSGSMADIAKASDNLNYFIQQGVIVSLTPYIEASPAMTALYIESPENFDTYAIGDDIYGIGKNRTTTRCLWLRKDVMLAHNLDMPRSLDQLEDLLVSLKACDDSDGGLIIPGDLSNLGIFASAFSLRPEIFIKEGCYVDPFMEDSFQAFSTYMKGLYDLGLFAPSFPVLDSYSGARRSFAGGDGYSLVMWDNAYSLLKTLLAEEGYREADLIPLTPFETEQGVFGLEYIPPSDPFVISSTCENPEDAFGVLEWMLTETSGILATSFGLEGYDYSVEDNAFTGISRVYHRGQSFPPIDQSFQMPYDLPLTIEDNLAIYDQVMDQVWLYQDRIPKKLMLVEHTGYNEVFVKIQKERNDLFFSYLSGDLTYEEMMTSYEVFYRDNGIDVILEELNGEK